MKIKLTFARGGGAFLALLFINAEMRAQNTFPAAGNAGINTTTPGYDMEVIGTVKTDTLLLGDNNVIGTANIAHLNFKISGTQIGRLEFDNVTGNQGQGAYLGNVFLGFEAGMSNSTGKRNVAIGTHAFRSNISGRASTAIGASALEDNTTGDFNVAVGEKTLPKNTTGMRNIAFGNEALFNNLDGHENIGIGVAALAANQGGSNNIGIGYTAGYGNTTGANNIAIGRSSLIGNSTGNDNTAIGHQANVGADGLTNATAIGANALVLQSNSLVLGNNANVGIGTSSPSEKLQVEGTIHSTTGGFKFPDGSIQTTAFDQNAVDALYWQFGGNTVSAGDYIGSNNSEAFVLKTNSLERMRIAANGKVGIGTNNPTAPLHITGFGTGDNCGTVLRLQHINTSQPNGCNIGPFDISWDLKTSQHNAFEIGNMNASSPVMILRSSDYNIGQPAMQVNGSISIFDGNGNTSLFFGQDHIPSNTYGKWGIQYVVPGQLAPHSKGGMNFWIPSVPGNPTFGNNFLFLADDGNVGIRTSNPLVDFHINGEIAISGSRLNVDPTSGNVAIASTLRIGPQAATTPFDNYRLSVDGSIVAKEVHVNLTTWADHVFDAKYNLRSLEQVEKFIQANNHLPEVPSEKEVIQNGINLGELNVVLLKKVEELTLYMIEMRKEIVKQKQQIISLEANNK